MIPVDRMLLESRLNPYRSSVAIVEEKIQIFLVIGVRQMAIIYKIPAKVTIYSVGLNVMYQV